MLEVGQHRFPTLATLETGDCCAARAGRCVHGGRYRLLHVAVRLVHTARRTHLLIAQRWPWGRASGRHFPRLEALPTEFLNPHFRTVYKSHGEGRPTTARQHAHRGGQPQTTLMTIKEPSPAGGALPNQRGQKTLVQSLIKSGRLATANFICIGEEFWKWAVITTVSLHVPSPRQSELISCQRMLA